MLKLPKDVVADPRHDAVSKLLAAHARPLWEGAKNQAPVLPMTDALAAELKAALLEGHASQGLELIADKLAAEQRGLDALRDKTPQNPRVSRLLFLADDGSTRFYRDADALLSRYPKRLMACRIGIAGEALGLALTGTPRMMRSVLVFDKRAAAKALFALLPEASMGS